MPTLEHLELLPKNMLPLTHTQRFILTLLHKFVPGGNVSPNWCEMRCYTTIHQRWTRYNCAVCTNMVPNAPWTIITHHVTQKINCAYRLLNQKEALRICQIAQQWFQLINTVCWWSDSCFIYLTIATRSLNICLYCSTVIHHNLVGDWNVNDNTNDFKLKFRVL